MYIFIFIIIHTLSLFQGTLLREDTIDTITKQPHGQWKFLHNKLEYQDKSHSPRYHNEPTTKMTACLWSPLKVTRHLVPSAADITYWPI